MTGIPSTYLQVAHSRPEQWKEHTPYNLQQKFGTGKASHKQTTKSRQEEQSDNGDRTSGSSTTNPLLRPKRSSFPFAIQCIHLSDEIDVGYHLSFCYSMYSSPTEMPHWESLEMPHWESLHAACSLSHMLDRPVANHELTKCYS